GALLVSWEGDFGRIGVGAIAIAAACVGWAIDNNLTRKLSSTDPLALAAWKGGGAGLFNIVLALASGATLPPAGLLLVSLLVGFVGYGLSLVFFVLALRHLGVARTGAYYSTAPFVGAVIAVLLLGEPVTVRLVIAGFLMALGVFLHITEVHAHWHRHQAL